jgi:hypothetical protein
MTKRRTLTPTVGGQSARMLYDLIEASPKAVLADGTVHLGLRLCEDHGRLWQSAYERVERDLMSEMEACPERAAHGSMLPHAWRSLVIHAMADRARRALGITAPHPYWC